MSRKGYLGGAIIRPGGPPPAQIGRLTIVPVPRPTGLASHVANVKRQNIVLDVATIVARWQGWLTPQTKVEVFPAALQNFAAAGSQHAAHGVKRFTFDGQDIFAVYAANHADEVAVIGLQTMAGLVTDVDRRANLSIDKQLEGNPQRLAQLQSVVAASITTAAAPRQLAQDLEVKRRAFDSAKLRAMQGGFGGDAAYAAMLAQYEAILGAPPPQDLAPAVMVDRVAELVTG